MWVRSLGWEDLEQKMATHCHNGNPLQYSCLENPMDRGPWWAKVHGLQRVGHDRVTNTFFLYTHTHTHTHTFFSHLNIFRSGNTAY